MKWWRIQRNVWDVKFGFLPLIFVAVYADGTSEEHRKSNDKNSYTWAKKLTFCNIVYDIILNQVFEL